MSVRRNISAAIGQILSETTDAHAAEVKALRKQLADSTALAQGTAQAEIKTLKRKLGTAQSAANLARRQRDTFKGKAAEYRTYASKYQRELAEARREIKELRKAQK